MSESEIVNFLAGQTIFLTGGTGFLGRVIVEKCLRVCQVKAIYLLIRPKKGKTVEERFEEYFDSPCFQNLKKENPDFKEKIIFVSGDCEKPNLGISKENEETLIQSANIVIHAAANVKFDQSLRTAANSILRSTMDILELAKKMVDLKSLIYVSTAYSNCPNKTIEEKIYVPPMTPKELLSVLEEISDDAVLDKITPVLLKEWPNTYPFTKSVVEYHLSCEGKGLPIGIMRPAIVTVCAEEPMPGWVDNFHSIIGYSVTIASGVLRCMNIKKSAEISIVPCDYVCNTILAALWDTATEKSNDVKVYNVCTSGKNPITDEKYLNLLRKAIFDYPSNRMVWYPFAISIENPLWHKFCRFFLQTIWAYFVDFVLICIRRKPGAVKLYKFVDEVIDSGAYFAVNEWNFITENRDNLWKKMSLEDKKLFNFNMNDFDWPSHVMDVVVGTRLYLLKDPLETVPKGKLKMKMFKIAHYALMALLLFLLYTFCTFIIDIFYNN